MASPLSVPASSYATVSPPFWSEAWILGGGASRKQFDLSRITDGIVLALNDALADSFTIADVAFSLDSYWVRRHRNLLESFPREKYVALPLETFPECGGISGVQYLQWGHCDGLSEDPAILNTGCNTGYAAINLAYLKQASVIHLVGYDMQPSDNERFEWWAPLFRNMLPQLAARNVAVLNHNLKSYIDAFPRVE